MTRHILLMLMIFPALGTLSRASIQTPCFSLAAPSAISPQRDTSDDRQDDGENDQEVNVLSALAPQTSLGGNSIELARHTTSTGILISGVAIIRDSHSSNLPPEDPLRLSIGAPMDLLKPPKRSA